MQLLQSEEATAGELISYAQSRGLDLGSLHHGGGFYHQGRCLFLRRNNGMIAYNGQGPIKVLPRQFEKSAGAFQGMWEEAGTVETMEQAFELARAWLLDGKEVDELPARSIRRCGI